METNKKNKTSLLQNIMRTIKLVWHVSPWLVSALMTLSILTSLIPFLVSGSRAYLIDRLIAITNHATASDTLWLAFGLVILATIIPSLLHTFGRYASKRFWFVTEASLEMTVLRKKGDLDVAVYEDPKQNDLLVRVHENGVWRLQNFTDRQFYIIQDIVQVVVATLILGAFNWWLIVIMVFGTIPELLVSLKYGKDSWDIFDDNAETRRRYWNLKGYFSRIEGIVELRLFQNLKQFLNRVQALFIDFQNEKGKVERQRFKLEIASGLLAQLAVIVVVGWSIFQVVQGQVMIGVFTFLVSSVGDFRTALSSFFQNLAKQYEDSLFVTDIFALLDLPPILDKPKKARKVLSNTAPDIVFENVSFFYPNTQKLVLKNINLHIPPGHKIALVGLNGSGKTTLVKLLCRFYDPTEGKILINGIDLRELDMESWYSRLGVLFQNYAKYNLPVKEAIAQGNIHVDLSLRRVKEAARLSESDRFITGWDKQYDQMLGREFTGGIDPSIGQWQKLALARVFYRNPSVMVLDEPTASIDAEAEAHIFDRLEKLSVGKTLVLISHRFSTVRKANTIVVIKDGAICEQGSHEELIRNNQAYAELFRLQAKGYA